MDDLAEKVIEESRPGRPVRVISGTTGRIIDAYEGSLCVVHINGALEDVPNNVTFSRSQYALKSVPDPFFELLRHDLVSRSIVFIGSTLEEGPLWQHLELRGQGPDRREKDFRPRSYLVTPSLNRSKQALLSRYKIEWLPMTAEQFCDRLLARMTAAKAAGNALLELRFREGNERGPKILRLADLPPPKVEPTEYLLGAEPEWADAQLHRIATRVCVDDIAKEIATIRAGAAARRFLIVTGTAGTGKSSAMMVAALRLQAEGVSVAWLDAVERYDAPAFRNALQREAGLGALFISNADLWDRRLSRAVREALEAIPRLVVVCECRSAKMDRMLDREELGVIEAVEYTIPFLANDDIDAILDVLDRENRLGVLKGLSRDARKRVFQAEAGRQMLVAMYKATHGREFKDKAVEELNELDSAQRFLYGLVCVAHAHRFFLSRDEIAIAFGDDIDQWPKALDVLTRRKLVLVGAGDTLKARHREIAQFVYDEMSKQGSISDAIRGLIKIAGTKTSAGMNRNARSVKMLAAFLNHETMKRTAGATVGRQIYSDFESLLSWDHHYWLHRGALELETGRLTTAENFLRTAKGIEPADVFIDNELAYLAFRKANEGPYSIEGETLMREAMDTLNNVAARRADQRPWVFHVMGSQGLIWSRKSRMSDAERKAFLGSLQRNVASVLDSDTNEILATLESDLRKEMLSLAVPRGI